MDLSQVSSESGAEKRNSRGLGILRVQGQELRGFLPPGAVIVGE